MPTTKTTLLKDKVEILKQKMERLKILKTRMLATPDQQISLTDPDARSIATRRRGSGMVGYNVQVAVDTTHNQIVANEVTNVGTDRSQLSQMAEKPQGVLETDELDVVADRGYFGGTEVLTYDESGNTVTLPRSQTSGNKRKGLFVEQDFRFLPDEDVYLCPADER